MTIVCVHEMLLLPVLRPGGSLAGGGGLLTDWEDEAGAGGRGGAWLRPWLPPPDDCFLRSEFFL